MGEAREVGGRKSEVGDSDSHGPDGAEEEEADGIRGVVDSGIAIIIVGDCRMDLVGRVLADVWGEEDEL